MRRVRWTPIILGLALVAPGAVAAQSVPAPQPERRPFQSEVILAETTAGLFLGFGIAWGMGVIGAKVLGPDGGEDPGLAGGLAGFAAGLALGSSLGVHLVARGYGFPASYFEALGGALAGVLLLPALPLDVDEAFTVAAIFLMPPVTSAIASAIGSSSRMRPVTGADADGVRLGVAVVF